MGKITTNASWRHLEMPAQVAHFILEKDISFKDYEILKRGFLPKTPQDAWFTYFADGRLHIFRSMSGFCIYIVSLMPEERFSRVIVNRDPQQYVVTDVEQDKVLLSDLLDVLIRFGGLERQRELIAAEKDRKFRQQLKDQENLERAMWG